MTNARRLPPLTPETRTVLRGAAAGCVLSCLRALERRVPDGPRGRATPGPSAWAPALALSASLARSAIPARGARCWAESAALVVGLLGLRGRAEQTSGSPPRLLAAPPLWALVAAHPEPGVWGDSRARRIGHALAVRDLFAALGGTDWPDSVLLAAGALAAALGPPGARLWVARAALAARHRGASLFERFFRTLLVTASGDGPSQE